jgi:hypothetical protein
LIGAGFKRSAPFFCHFLFPYDKINFGDGDEGIFKNHFDFLFFFFYPKQRFLFRTPF